MSFLVWHSTTTGPSHSSNNSPCQDACTIATSADGIWTSVAVCDGCGSKTNADIGAHFASDFLASSLLELAKDVERKGPGEWVIDRSVVLLSKLREKLRDTFGDDITEYAATIVAALVSQSGGFIIHVGDGVASSLAIEGEHDNPALDVLTQSDPENGEYINQTFYLTEPNWIHHVRITALSNVECLVVCTDGAQTLFYESNKPYDRALLPVFQALRENPTDGNAFLQSVMSNPEADARSSDDKTVAIIARSGFLEAAAGITHALKEDKNAQALHRADAVLPANIPRLRRRPPQTGKAAKRFSLLWCAVALTILWASFLVFLLYSRGYFDDDIALVRGHLSTNAEIKPEVQKMDRMPRKSHSTSNTSKLY